LIARFFDFKIKKCPQKRRKKSLLRGQKCYFEITIFERIGNICKNIENPTVFGKK
jgi:hypothetical protein